MSSETIEAEAIKVAADREKAVDDYVKREGRYLSWDEGNTRSFLWYVAAVFWIASAGSCAAAVGNGPIYAIPGSGFAVVAMLCHITQSLIRLRATIRAAASRQ